MIPWFYTVSRPTDLWHNCFCFIYAIKLYTLWKYVQCIGFVTGTISIPNSKLPNWNVNYNGMKLSCNITFDMFCIYLSRCGINITALCPMLLFKGLGYITDYRQLVCRTVGGYWLLRNKYHTLISQISRALEILYHGTKK